MYLDSRGVVFRNGAFERPRRYKLFGDRTLRSVVLRRLARQLVKTKSVRPKPRVTLCLAAGKIASITDRAALEKHMDRNRWKLFDEDWIREQLQSAANAGYENDVAHVVAKLIAPNGTRKQPRRPFSR